MTSVPSTSLQEGDLSTQDVHNAVAQLAGGAGFEDDGTTVLFGFDEKGHQLSTQATLATFIHLPSQASANPVLSANDGYQFLNMEYTFKPNIAPLLTKNLVTLGCIPSIALNRAFVNNIFAGDIGLKTKLLGDLVNGSGFPGNPAIFPDPGAAQACLTTALSNLRTNLTVRGVAEFQTHAILCLNGLLNDTNSALGNLIGIGFDPCKSTFTLTPTAQFTSLPILVTVDLNERNGLPLTTGISPDIGANIAARIQAHASFGDVGPFSYDGYQSFNANLTSKNPGKGSIMISFDNQTFCTNNLPPASVTPANGDFVPTHTLQAIDYQFIYAPVGPSVPGQIAPTGEGDADGQPRRDAGDISGDKTGGGEGGS
jgi:hypothetical protein